MSRSAFAAAALAATLALTGSARADEPRTWDRTFTVESRPTIRIRTDDSRVTIRSWKDARVKIHVERHGSTHGLFVGRRRTTVAMDQQGNEVSVVVRDQGPRSGIVFDTSRLETEVWVPNACDLVVDTQDGSVRIDDVRGRLDVETQDGSLTANRLRGDVHVRSQDGRVELDDVDGALHLETHDGSSEVRGRFDVVDVQSADGGIELEAEPGSKMREEWSLRSSDGTIRLRIPHDLAATIDARTADGGLSIDLPLTVRDRIREHHVVGELNGGGPTLRLRANDGTIRVTAID